ncbi:MAG: hypothetical protein V7701_17305, partial [Sneathiella sp.]
MQMAARTQPPFSGTQRLNHLIALDNEAIAIYTGHQVWRIAGQLNYRRAIFFEGHISEQRGL